MKGALIKMPLFIISQTLDKATRDPISFDHCMIPLIQMPHIPKVGGNTVDNARIQKSASLIFIFEHIKLI